MSVTTIFLTRYVADQDAALRWYEAFFGRPPSGHPLPACHEWEIRPGVIFQVIHQAERAGATTFAFGVDDLAGERERLAGTALSEAESFDVNGFDDLTYVAYADPEGVATGLLNTAG